MHRYAEQKDTGIFRIVWYKDIHYFLLYSGETAVGMVKVNLCGVESCEISSFYILDEYRNKGYGKQCCIWGRYLITSKCSYGYWRIIEKQDAFMKIMALKIQGEQDVSIEEIFIRNCYMN